MGSFMDELTYLQAFKRLNRTLDRTRDPRIMQIEGICICVLGTSSRHIYALLEGGEICPGDVVLALSPDWLQREAVEDVNAIEIMKKDSRAVEVLEKEHRQVLLVKKALTFDRGGNSYLDVFEPARRVTYFINEMPESFDASGLDCAMNGCNSTTSLLEDRLLWCPEMSETNVSLPPCVVLPGDLSADFKQKLEKIPELKLMKISLSEDMEVTLEHDIIDLLSTVPSSHREFVVRKRISGASQREMIPGHDSTYWNRLSKEWQSLCEDEYITSETIRKIPTANGTSKDCH